MTDPTPTPETPDNNETPVAPVEQDMPTPQSRPRWNWMMVVLPVVFFALGLGAGYLIWGGSISLFPSISRNQQPGEVDPTALAAANAEPSNEITIPESLTRYDIAVDENDAAWGNEDAPITLVEFSDYQCPYCEKWYTEVLSPLMTAYPDKIRFVYKDFPLGSIHSEAVNAAVAAKCAGEQDAYWAYHNALFSRQYELGEQGYKQYASDMGLDMNQFTQCIQEQKYKDEVLADYEYASGIGVQSTPTFFLNGIPIIGAQPYDIFKQVIELELAGKLPKE